MNRDLNFPNSKHLLAASSLVACLVAIPAPTNAEMVFKYRSSSLVSTGSNESGSHSKDVSSDCYAELNRDTIGNSSGCQGMLIVSDSTLRSVASSRAEPSGGFAGYSGGGGDETFKIDHGGDEYTFSKDGKDIFTGQVSDMSYLFASTSFDGDISYWDTSSVDTMDAMFWKNTSFDMDIGGWDISNMESTYSMFHKASSFNQNISLWETSKITTMYRMFDGASSFDHDISTWDVSSVVDYSYFSDGSPIKGTSKEPNF